MKLGKIGQLSEVIQVLYDREYLKVSGLLAEETRIRSQLTQLDTQSRKACANNVDMQAVSALFLWQRWSARSRQQLNSELAQVMAKKLMAMDRVRKAFCRKQALAEIESTETLASAKRRNKKRELNLGLIPN